LISFSKTVVFGTCPSLATSGRTSVGDSLPFCGVKLYRVRFLVVFTFQRSGRLANPPHGESRFTSCTSTSAAFPSSCGLRQRWKRLRRAAVWGHGCQHFSATPDESHCPHLPERSHLVRPDRSSYIDSDVTPAGASRSASRSSPRYSGGCGRFVQSFKASRI